MSLGPLCAAFFSSGAVAPREVPDALGAPDELEQALAALHGAGRSAWPDVDLPAETFARHLGRRLAGRDVADALGALHAEDLYLACACAHAVPGALSAFERAYAVYVPAFVRRVDPSPAFADDVLQLLRERLFVPTPDAAAKIGEYEGRSDLVGWVRTVALRIALDLRRGKAARVEVGRDGTVPEGEDPTLAAGLDPEMGYLKAHYREAFRDAFTEALGRLDPTERNLLRMHAVDGLGVERLGQLFGVSAATASRRLAACRERLGQDTRRILQERLGLAPAELQSLAGLVRSQLDLSLPRLLRR